MQICSLYKCTITLIYINILNIGCTNLNTVLVLEFYLYKYTITTLIIEYEVFLINYLIITELYITNFCITKIILNTSIFWITYS
jgi:hypothetical protein